MYRHFASMEGSNEELNQFAKTDKGKISFKGAIRSHTAFLAPCSIQLFMLLFHNSEYYSIAEGSLSAHHSTICCRLESDRNTTGSIKWRTEGHRGWIPYQRPVVL